MDVQGSLEFCISNENIRTPPPGITAIAARATPASTPSAAGTSRSRFSTVKREDFSVPFPPSRRQIEGIPLVNRGVVGVGFNDHPVGCFHIENHEAGTGAQCLCTALDHLLPGRHDGESVCTKHTRSYRSALCAYNSLISGTSQSLATLRPDPAPPFILCRRGVHTSGETAP